MNTIEVRLKDHLVNLLYSTGYLDYDAAIEAADYLIAHGIQPHFLPENAKIYRIVEYKSCKSDAPTPSCPVEDCCEDCQLCCIEKKVVEGRYSQLYDDMLYRDTVFKTYEEAEKKLKES